MLQPVGNINFFMFPKYSHHLDVIITIDDIKKCAEEEEKRIYSSQEALKFHGMFSNRHPTGLLNTAIYEVVDKSIKDLYEKRQTYLDEKGTVTGKDKRNSSLDNKFSIYS